MGGSPAGTRVGLFGSPNIFCGFTDGRIRSILGTIFVPLVFDVDGPLPLVDNCGTGIELAPRARLPVGTMLGPAVEIGEEGGGGGLDHFLDDGPLSCLAECRDPDARPVFWVAAGAKSRGACLVVRLSAIDGCPNVVEGGSENRTVPLLCWDDCWDDPEAGGSFGGGYTDLSVLITRSRCVQVATYTHLHHYQCSTTCPPRRIGQCLPSLHLEGRR